MTQLCYGTIDSRLSSISIPMSSSRFTLSDTYILGVVIRYRPASALERFPPSVRSNQYKNFVVL